MPAKKKAAPATPLPTKKAKSKPVAHDALEPLEKVASITTRRLPLHALKAHPRNPRKHPDPGSPEWDVLKASLEYDYFDPIVWNERNGQLVSGHLRTKVLKSINFTHADVVVVNYDEPTHIARLMAANKAIGENDTDRMRELFSELKGLETFDMALTGFDLPEIDEVFGDTESGSSDGSEPGEGTHDSSGGMSPAEIDARIKYLTAAIGSGDYPIEAGQVAVVDKTIAILCAFSHGELPAALVRWIAATDPQVITALDGMSGVNRPCRLLYGADALTLVEKAPSQLAPGSRWVVICPTVASATSLLAVYKAHYKTKAKVKIIQAPVAAMA